MGTKNEKEAVIEIEEYIEPGDLVELIPQFSDPSLKNPGLVTKVIALNEEVEVYWNESFPQEIEYTSQLFLVKKGENK